MTTNVRNKVIKDLETWHVYVLLETTMNRGRTLSSHGHPPCAPSAWVATRFQRQVLLDGVWCLTCQIHAEWMDEHATSAREIGGSPFISGCQLVLHDIYFVFLSVESCTDLTPLHSCTFASLCPALLYALDHHSNALALAQVVPQNRVALVMVAERR